MGSNPAIPRVRWLPLGRVARIVGRDLAHRGRMGRRADRPLLQRGASEDRVGGHHPWRRRAASNAV